MFTKYYEKTINLIISLSLKHPYKIILFTLLATVPSLYFISDISVGYRSFEIIATRIIRRISLQKP